METKVNYTLVGLFVILLSAACFIIALWLSVGLKRQPYSQYLVYVSESVAGLSPNAAVKYNGVNVGKVAQIALRPKKPEQVRILLDIEDGTPISTDTEAVLETQGLTGVAYIELKGGKPGAPPLVAQKGHKYPVIQSAPSLMFRLDAAMSQLSKDIDDISNGLTNLLDEENIAAVSDTLENLKQFTTTLSDNRQKLDVIMTDTQTTMQNVSQASEQLPQVINSIQQSAQSVQAFSKTFTEAGEQAKVTLHSTQVTMQTINNQLMPEALSSLNAFNATMTNIEGLSEELEQNPSMIIRGKQPPPPGPGEQRQ